MTDRKILTHKVQEGHEAATRTKTAVNLESFDIRTANGDALPGELVVTEAVYFDESLTVDFCVDVDRKEPKAGEYTGSLKIVGDTRDRPFEVPIVITIKDSAWHLALLTAMAGSVVGALWGLISALFLARGSSGSSPIKEDLQRVSAIAALAGVAIGAYVFIESYVASPDFAGGFPDRGLVSVGFAIGVTANPIVAAVNAFVTDMFSGDETEENP